MSRSLDQSRPLKAGRHRAEAAPSVTQPVAPTSPDTEEPTRGTVSTDPVSTTVIPTVQVPTEPTQPVPTLRRSRNRRPAFEVPPAPGTAPVTEAAPEAAPKASAPETALMAEVPPAAATTRRSRIRRAAVEKPMESTPDAAADGEPMSALSPQVAAAFSSQPDDVLKNAVSVRVMGQRMAVVAGAFAVLLGVGAASQATELPFFGKEASAQEAPGGTDATRGTSGTRPTTGTATPRPTVSATSPGISSGAPAPAAAGGDVPAAVNPLATSLPGIGSLPMPVDAPTLAAITGATSAAAPPASATSSNTQPAAPSSNPQQASSPSAVPAPATTAAPAPAPSQSPTTALTPITGLLDPLLGTATASEPGIIDGAADSIVDTTSYATTQLTSYGWGAEEMTALNTLWDTSAQWHGSQVDRGLTYIKQRYGSPTEALKFREANNWY